MTSDSFNLEKMFGALAKAGPVALAVSGGSDSMGLMHLFAEWRRDNRLDEGQRDVVLTVDHGLRPESGDDVAFVKEAAMARGFRAEGLKLEGLAGLMPGSGLQARARETRYEALAAAMGRFDAVALLTGHTLDDQAETLLMRLKRGSGVQGLAAMRPVRQLHGVTVRRPLLSHSRQEVRAWLKGRNVSWREDPGNENEDFERVALRRLLSELDDTGEVTRLIGLSARRLQRVQVALDALVREFIREKVTSDVAGFLDATAADFLALADELQCQVLERMLNAFGSAVRLAKIESAVRKMTQMKEGARHAVGGVIIRREARAFRLYREADRQAVTPVIVKVGPKRLDDVIWDRRVKLSFRNDTVGAVRLRALSQSEVEVLRLYFRDSGEAAPAGADVLRGLCSVWQGGRAGVGEALVSIPQLNEEVQENIKAAMSVAGFEVVGYQPGGAVSRESEEKMTITADFPVPGWELGA